MSAERPLHVVGILSIRIVLGFGVTDPAHHFCHLHAHSCRRTQQLHLVSIMYLQQTAFELRSGLLPVSIGLAAC